MSAPNFTILTQKELTIDLSRPAMEHLLDVLGDEQGAYPHINQQVQCEIDNFRNTLQNLMERSDPKPKPENFDLIGA